MKWIHKDISLLLLLVAKVSRKGGERKREGCIFGPNWAKKLTPLLKWNFTTVSAFYVVRATHPQNLLSLQRQYSVLKLVQRPFTLSLFRGGPVHFAAQLSYCSHLSWGGNGICQQIHSWFEFSTFTCNDPTALVFDCDPEMTLFRLILYAQALILALHVCCYSKQQAARVFIRSTACKNSHINTVWVLKGGQL